jgi:hypothetical protein
VFQGGTNVQFTTSSAMGSPPKALEFCVNDVDNDATNNLGGYEVDLRVDQLGP